jgi:hypothetical protein
VVGMGRVAGTLRWQAAHQNIDAPCTLVSSFFVALLTCSHPPPLLPTVLPPAPRCLAPPAPCQVLVAVLLWDRWHDHMPTHLLVDSCNSPASHQQATLCCCCCHEDQSLYLVLNSAPAAAAGGGGGGGGAYTAAANAA